MGSVTTLIAASPITYIGAFVEVLLHTSSGGVALSDSTNHVSVASFVTSLLTIDLRERIKSFAFCRSAGSDGMPSLNGLVISMPSSVPTVISVSVIEVMESAYGTFSKSSAPMSLIACSVSGLNTSSDSKSSTIESLLPKSSLNRASFFLADSRMLINSSSSAEPTLKLFTPISPATVTAASKAKQSQRWFN